VSRIGESSVSIDGITDIAAESLGSYPRLPRPSPKVIHAPLDLSQRREKVRRLMDAWQHKLEVANRLVATGNGAGSLLANPALSELLYTLDAGGVLDVRRSGAEDDVEEAARRLVRTARERLNRLGERRDG
jgi:hypothetical protein